MSKAPRTDALLNTTYIGDGTHFVELSRQLEAENAALRGGILRVAQLVEGLKLPCSMDPESPQAIRNGTYQSIALIARALLAKVSG